MSVSFTLRMDEDLKRELDEISANLGLTTTAALNVMAKRFVAEQGFPFDVKVPQHHVPNAVTRRAMVEAEAREMGLIPDDSPTFATVDDALAYLDREANVSAEN